MQTAWIYIRVSTEEQANSGYSQRSQQDRLEKFCLLNNLSILDVYFEDHSAKTFDRPVWKMLMVKLQKFPALRPNLILFTKWDRFSRNVGEAYYMISRLNQLGIELKAIDQEIDMSIPENKILLAVYLATSEAENGRRSLNIKQGIYRARQEGRWTAHAPLGYLNVSINGQKNVVVKQPEATSIRNIFAEILRNSFCIRSLYKIARENGLCCSESQFWRVLKNPFYCGFVNVGAFEQQDEHLVTGKHEPLVSQNIFYQVQNILSTRKHKTIRSTDNGQLMFKGVLVCPICKRRLTGSGSKGRSKRYFYYHCRYPCTFRTRADELNITFINMLNKLEPQKPYVEIYKEVVINVRGDLYANQPVSKKTLRVEIDRSLERILNAKDLMTKGEIDSQDFLSIKEGCEKRINMFAEDFQHLSKDYVNRDKRLKKALQFFKNPYDLYTALPLPEKRLLLKLLFNDRIELMNSISSVDVINPLFQCICTIGNEISSLHKHYQTEDVSENINYLVGKITEIEAYYKRSASKIKSVSILNMLNKLAIIAEKHN